MKKEHRGLRIREFLVMLLVLWLVPYFLLFVRFGDSDPERFGWRRAVVMVVWAVVAAILACVAEDRLEARGRYVESGVDIGLADIGAWLRRNGYRLNLGSALFVAACAALIAMVEGSWHLAVLVGLVAMNAIFAVAGKPIEHD